MKTFLFRSMIGIFYGGFIAVLFTILYISLGDNNVLDGQLFVKNSLGAIFCGWFFTVSPLYFELTQLKLYQQTALHFATVFILYFILAFYINWVPFNLASISFVIGIFISFYVVMWFVFYLYFKKQAKKLTEELQNI